MQPQGTEAGGGMSQQQYPLSPQAVVLFFPSVSHSSGGVPLWPVSPEGASWDAPALLLGFAFVLLFMATLLHYTAAVRMLWLKPPYCLILSNHRGEAVSGC